MSVNLAVMQNLILKVSLIFFMDIKPIQPNLCLL